MLNLIVRRLVASVGILVAVSLAVFLMVGLMPGDAARVLAGDSATPDRIAYFRQQLGLDQPVLVRYGRWVWDAVHGNLGQSLTSYQDVTKVLLPPLSVTATLLLFTLVFAAVLGMAGGIVTATRPGSPIDRAVTSLAAVAIAVPPFWVALLLIAFFAVGHRWFPAVGYVSFFEDPLLWAWHLILPAIALGALPGAEFALQLRDALISEMRRDYVQVAFAKGLPPRQLVLKHALKNAAIPVVTVFGYRAGQLLGGAVTIEVPFNLPGLGQVAVSSVLGRDVPVLLGMVVITTIGVVFINLCVDLSYGYLNPKVRA